MHHARRQGPLLLLGLEDVGSALVTSQQVGPVVGGEEARQGLDARHDTHQIVIAQSKDRRHEVVTLALIAQQDGQTVSEEGEHIPRQCRHSSLIIDSTMLPINVIIRLELSGNALTICLAFIFTEQDFSY